jgi:hypothetical protein
VWPKWKEISSAASRFSLCCCFAAYLAAMLLHCCIVANSLGSSTL